MGRRLAAIFRAIPIAPVTVTRSRRNAAWRRLASEAMARSKDVKIGHFIVEFATPGIGQILKGAGCDFALFDTEHSGFGFETIKSVLRYMQAADLPTIVRVPSDGI